MRISLPRHLRNDFSPKNGANQELDPPNCSTRVNGEFTIATTQMLDTLGTTRNKFFGPFLWVVTGTGCLAFLYALARVNVAQFDSRFVLLVAMALLRSEEHTSELQ